MKWPFLETPAFFADRLAAAHAEFRGDMLAAVRAVLIEDPPQLADRAARAVRQQEAMDAFHAAWAHAKSNPTLHADGYDKKAFGYVQFWLEHLNTARSSVGTNAGHGHVWERQDKLKVRCGGPPFCRFCFADAAIAKGERHE